MSSRGTIETSKLCKNLENQLNRLILQLSDVENNKSELEPEEYQEMKKDTLDQLTEFNFSLNKIKQGDLSLVDDCNNMQILIQSTISKAFQTPLICKMFENNEHVQLRERLKQIDRIESKKDEKFKILISLKKSGNILTSEEEEFIMGNSKPNNFSSIESLRSSIKNDSEVLGIVRQNVKEMFP